MSIKAVLENKNISMYELAKRTNLSYSIVHNIISGKTDLQNCPLSTAIKISDVLELSIEDLVTICDKKRTFTWFRSEQCHLVHRKGEVAYMIDILKNREIDRYWRLSMYAEAMYQLAMVDYICRRNNIPKCENYNFIRSHKLDHPAYPIDATLKDAATEDDSIKEELLESAIPEFLAFNIIEGDIFDDTAA